MDDRAAAAVRLPLQGLEAMVAHARFTYPEEACGLVAGPTAGDVRMVFCLTNRDRSRYRFRVDPTEHYRVIQHVERLGWDVVGVFHSHPHSAAIPSAADIAGALDPRWVYFVVGLASVATPRVRAFAIVDGRAAELPIELAAA